MPYQSVGWTYYIMYLERENSYYEGVKGSGSGINGIHPAAAHLVKEHQGLIILLLVYNHSS